MNVVRMVGGVLGLCVIHSVACASERHTESVINLQLRWHNQFQFAGYYAAVAKGYYRAEGLDVRIHSGDPTHQPVDQVLSGHAQYAEGNSEVLYQRLQGKPLVALAAVFQHSPSVLLTLKSSGIRSVHDLIGKKVMLANKSEDTDFLTMFLNEGIKPSQINIVPSSYNLEDLISGKVDAFNSYSTNEPYVLQQRHIPYYVIDPLSYRVDFYSDIFFTTEQELRQHPQRVAAMLRATIKGWRYAMNHRDEIIELLKTQYHVKKSRAHMRYEAKMMQHLIVPQLIEIGHINPERFKHMADTFVNAGLAKDERYLDGFIYNPHHTVTAIPLWLRMTLLVAIILAIIASMITVCLHRFNRRLAEAQKTLLQSEERFKALSMATYGGLIIHDNGVILECNSGLSDISGYDYDELIGMHCSSLVEESCLEEAHQKMVSDYTDSYEVTSKRRDGSTHPVMVKGKRIMFRGKEARVIEVIDLTEHKQREAQLQLAASVFTHANEGIIIMDADGNILDVNKTFSQITGYAREDVLGQSAIMFKFTPSLEKVSPSILTSLMTTKQWSGELWNRHKDGHAFASLVTIGAVCDTQECVKNYVALFSDITQMKHHQQQLEHIAHYDVVTNLPNRMLLSDRLHYAMTQSDRYGQCVAVAYLDLDGFKAVNDTHGHSVGDELLRKLSARMNENLRESDTLARIGGDEFVAVLVNIDSPADCELVLERLLNAAMTPVSIDGQWLQVSTSIGVTYYPQDRVDADQLMRHADQAMYIAKQSGKNRFHCFDIHQDQSIQTQHETLERIQQGLDNQEFMLHYQPKVNMRTGQVIGVEALIRWNHPQRGLIFPGDFLSVVNHTGMSLTLGNWVLEAALKQMAAWQKVGLMMPVSVNIDGYQLQQKTFVTDLQRLLNAYPDIPPSMLQLEILETSALGDIADVSQVIRECIQAGVSFALDDFGTGFSSLTYLRRLPIEALKIDQSFVRNMLIDPDDREIVMAVISLASAFNLNVIAEGVENVELGRRLLEMGCHLAQGYGVARAMPGEYVPDWVINWTPSSEWRCHDMTVPSEPFC